jgi:hypothetical protein
MVHRQTHVTMETMHAVGRRRLPPVPRARVDHGSAAEPALGTADDALTERWTAEADPGAVRARARGRGTTAAAPSAPPSAEIASRPTPADHEDSPRAEQDAAQQFVARLRAAAADFAEAAGATSAVVREAVPPARHRRSRCRLVLRFADDTESDQLLLGPSGTPGSPSRHGFDRQIRRWLAAGRLRDDAWLVADPDAPEGMAVDVSAWLAAS